MKRIVSFLAVLLLCVAVSFTVAGCSQNTQEPEAVNPMSGRVYIHVGSKSEALPFSYMRFYDDNTFRGISVTGAVGNEAWSPFYGNYDLNGNAVTLNLLNQQLAGAVLDGGAQVVFGTELLQDNTQKIESDSSVWQYLSD